MRSAVAVIMAILGVLLVLSGAGAFWAAALARPAATPTSTSTPTSTFPDQAPATRFGRGLEVAGRLPTPDRLILWGVVLLALSAVAAGAITFSVTANAGLN